MRFTIAAVGRFTKGRGKGAGAHALFDDYAGRLSAPIILKSCEESVPCRRPRKSGARRSCWRL